MDIRQLKYLLSVSQLGSVTAAADAHFVTQPAVTAQLRKLEGEVGGALFHRVGRGVVLTDLGRRVAAHAADIVARLSALENDVAQVRGLRGGVLRLGNIDAASVYVLPGIYRSFQRRYPDVDIEIVVGDTQHLVEAVEGGELEMATTTLPVESTAVDAVEIYREDLVAVVSPSNELAGKKRVSADDLVAEGLITYPQGAVTRRIIDAAFRALDVRVRAKMAISSPEAMKRLTQSGLGVSVLPKPLVSGELKRGTLKEIRIQKLKIHRAIGMIWRSTSALSPPAEKFLEMVRKRFDV